MRVQSTPPPGEEPARGYHGQPGWVCFPGVEGAGALLDHRLAAEAARAVQEGVALDGLPGVPALGLVVERRDLAVSEAPAEVDLVLAVAHGAEVDQALLDVADLGAEVLEQRDVVADRVEDRARAHDQAIHLGHAEQLAARDQRGSQPHPVTRERDRKSTRLNSSHLVISYA